MRFEGFPVVETARLRLRAPRSDDFSAAEIFLGSDRARYIGGPYERRAAWRGFCSTVATWLLDGYGYWGVERRDDGVLVGSVGFIGAPAFPEHELGWDLFDAAFEGRGYATEAATAARDWWFGDFGGPTLVSYVDPENAGSIAVAERLGAARDDAAQRVDPTDLVFRHPPPDAIA
jgi:RimJ/RimL family protein N-acetyltransferase